MRLWTSSRGFLSCFFEDGAFLADDDDVSVNHALTQRFRAADVDLAIFTLHGILLS